MPHNNSAAKRLRKNETRRVANKSRLTELKTLRKRLERHIHDGQTAEAKAVFVTFSKRVDQAASINTVHKNTASRLKSRLALALAKPVVKPTGAKSAAKPADAK
jgi:small subunit ribosomal protein S20